MGFRDDLVKRIEKKKAEIAELQARQREASSYLQALEDMLKLIPRDAAAPSSVEAPADLLRPNSAVAKARDLIRKAGQPLHVEALLAGLGKPVNKANRAALSGSLGNYTRKGEIFIKTAPNTFGLKEMRSQLPARNGVDASVDDSELPPTFGMDEDNSMYEENEENEEIGNTGA